MSDFPLPFGWQSDRDSYSRMNLEQLRAELKKVRAEQASSENPEVYDWNISEIRGWIADEEFRMSPANV